MAFRVCEPEVRTLWVNTNGSSTYYLGQLVAWSKATKAMTEGAVCPLVNPNNAHDADGFHYIAGVVVGLNDKTPIYNSTGQYATGVTTQAAQLARSWQGAEGMYHKGDPQLLVKIALITPTTVIEGDIFNAAIGVAPTVITDTGGADTTGYTSAGTTTATQFTPVASLCTIYCRTGKNAGLYRVTTDTSTTAPAVTVGFPYDVALGDTFVRVPLKQGLSYIYTNTGLFIDCSQTAATHHYDVIVLDMDLSVAGRERARFMFSPLHFMLARA